MQQAFGVARSEELRPSRSDSFESPRPPQLALEKTRWLDQFASSLDVLVQGPVPPKEFLGDPFFRDCWIEQRFPKIGFAVAVALQVLLIVFPPPIWSVHPPHVVAPPLRMELTWYGPVKDLPTVMPTSKLTKTPSRNEIRKVVDHRAANAFHPRQTIISEPLHPTHPRQTLLQPTASQEPPKILPQLPNIVRLASSEPTRPKMQLSPEQLAAMRPKSAASLRALDAPAPDVSAAEKVPGTINIPSVAQALAKPILPVSPMSAPRAIQQRNVANSSVPDVAGRTGEINTLIALSTTPAPVAPPPSIPAGNLSARISISPDGQQPGGSAAHTGASAGPAQGGGHGPEGIFITGGSDTNVSPVSGLGSARRGIGAAHSSPRSQIAPGDSNMPPGSSESGPKLDALTGKMLGAKRVYTLYVNMPNLTSASGSWILNFAELDDVEAGPHLKAEASDLSGPVPLRKIDPKYPPQLRAGNVEGDVLLYAIIRKDGSVDSIQLVRGVEPILNANAMEALAQWKFQPAEKYGKPVDLEAVVHIPFRSRVRQF